MGRTFVELPRKDILNGPDQGEQQVLGECEPIEFAFPKCLINYLLHLHVVAAENLYLIGIFGLTTQIFLPKRKPRRSPSSGPVSSNIENNRDKYMYFEYERMFYKKYDLVERDNELRIG